MVVDAFEKGKKAAFARKAGISPQGAQELLAGRRGEPSFKVLVKILESYPQVRIEWLVLGKGPMLKEGMGTDLDSIFESQGATVVAQLGQEVELLSKNLSNAIGSMSGLKEEYQSLMWLASEVAVIEKKSVITAEDQLVIDELENKKSEISAQATPLRALINDLTSKLAEKKSQYSASVSSMIDTSQDVLSSIYRVSGAPDYTRLYNGLLSKRLDISDETARQLVADGKIRAVKVGEDGYRVTELAVREFLGESPITKP